MKSSQVYYHHSKTGMQLASFPGPSRGGGERVWYSPFITHGTVRHAEPANDHHGNAIGCYGDPSACACSVYQALSPPPLKGPGNEARLY